MDCASSAHDLGTTACRAGERRAAEDSRTVSVYGVSSVDCCGLSDPVDFPQPICKRDPELRPAQPRRPEFRRLIVSHSAWHVSTIASAGENWIRTKGPTCPGMRRIGQPVAWSFFSRRKVDRVVPLDEK